MNVFTLITVFTVATLVHANASEEQGTSYLNDGAIMSGVNSTGRGEGSTESTGQVTGQLPGMSSDFTHDAEEVEDELPHGHPGERSGPLSLIHGMMMNPMAMFAGRSSTRRIEHMLMQILMQMQQLTARMPDGHQGAGSFASSAGGFFGSNSDHSRGEPSFSSNGFDGFSTGSASSINDPFASSAGNLLNRPASSGSGFGGFRLPSVSSQQNTSSISGFFNRPSGSSFNFDSSSVRPSLSGFNTSSISGFFNRGVNSPSSPVNGVSWSTGVTGSSINSETDASVNRPLNRPSVNHPSTPLPSNEDMRNENSLDINSSVNLPSVALPSTSTNSSVHFRPSNTHRPSNAANRLPQGVSSGFRLPVASVTASPFTLSPSYGAQATRSPPISGLELGYGSDGSELPLKSARQSA